MKLVKIIGVTFWENITDIGIRVDHFAVNDNSLHSNFIYDYLNAALSLPGNVFMMERGLSSKILATPNFDRVLSLHMEASSRFTELELDATDSIRGATGPFSTQIRNPRNNHLDAGAHRITFYDSEGSIENVKRR